jgi:hypothetical protein
MRTEAIFSHIEICVKIAAGSSPAMLTWECAEMFRNSCDARFRATFIVMGGAGAKGGRWPVAGQGAVILRQITALVYLIFW